ncbi:helix-turn-helix domain-containing protein [Nocardioides sp. WS12]|uniref:helix-turn-helix domain-containing protein n=1 Tax=Nocardioides sp. WS12 TaxID=2486272 RepID=UPI0015FE59F2|nr:helix-turn-helix domain-containing protein [Nocardioides sp. WS12]
MNENGLQAIGRVAKARRERLGLNQDELAQYGGPKVATVGKFERAAAESFPLRTQHQIENALGWTRGTVEEFAAAVDEGVLEMGDWEHELVVENIPDLSRPVVPAGADADPLEVSQAVEALAGIARLLEPDRLSDAVHDAVLAMLPYLSATGATRLGRDLRADHDRKGGDGNAENRDPRGAAPMTLGVIDDSKIVTRQDSLEHGETPRPDPQD